MFLHLIIILQNRNVYFTNYKSEDNVLVRISGINIPLRKRIEVALTYIYGIGPSLSKKICSQLSILKNIKVSSLSEDQFSQIREYINSNIKVEGDLRRSTSMNIKRLLDLGCYRGVRHRKRLPVRGQRTSTNARTRKGKSLPIAGKKK